VRLLRAATAGLYDVMLADSSRRTVIPRGSTLPKTTIVIGGSASVGANVRGDIIVVGGDLFLRPGASIDGRAVAIGGGVYGSTLATVRAGTRSFRDRTFDLRQTASGAELDYRRLDARDAKFELPLLDGLRVPSYDRVEGASIPWGPILRPTAKLELEPTVVYRSHMGAWDPGLHALLTPGEIWRLTLDARRGTFTNDDWIQSDLINSFNSLVAGTDTRNYYRADRIELGVGRTDHIAKPAMTMELETVVGLITERAWSLGAADTLGARPWSVIGRDDVGKLRRPNPPIEPGRITSPFLATTARWQYADVRANAFVRVEMPVQAPSDVRFVQITTDATIQFPTFGVQRFRADMHVVATPGDTAPPQRFAYLGGSGTLPAMDEPLQLGGDQLLYLDSRYEIPFPRLRIPFVGEPTLSLRHRVGTAGVQRLPRFVQNVGVMATLSFFRVEYSLDPANREDHWGASLSFAR